MTYFPPSLSENCEHVVFWEGRKSKMRTSTADIPHAMIRPWTDRDSAESLILKNRRRKDWNDSIDLAEKMVHLTQGSLGCIVSYYLC